MLTLMNVAYAESKTFQATIDNDVLLERLYESKEIQLTVTQTSDGDQFLNNSVLTGEAGFDAVTGRIIIELDQLSKSGIPMKVVGFVVDKDQEKGIDACIEWQTRMFENTKLCYAAEVRQGHQVRVVLSIDDLNNAAPTTSPAAAPGLAAEQHP